MKGLHLNRRTVFLWADLALVTAALCCTTYSICDLADGLSFGGFFVLFMLVVLGLYFMGLLGALIVWFTFSPPQSALFADLSGAVRTFLTIPV